MISDLISLLKKYQAEYASVVPVDFQKEKYIIFDFTANNPDLHQFDLMNIADMDAYIFGKIKEANAKAGVGGYDEERLVYQKSPVFDTENGSRSIHLGIDIWMPAGTPVFAPMPSKVHSFRDNANFGDYGPTIILEHQLENIVFYSLYGHLSRESLTGLYEGKIIEKGQQFATFGDVEVNGNWVPHLHFQLMRDLLGKKGDFIGVAPKQDKEYYLDNCPDPNLILNIKHLI